MTIVEKMLVRQAIELSAVIGDHSEKILNLVTSFLKSEFNVNIPLDYVRKELDKASAARLFFACGKSKPEEIRNPQNCLRLARYLWLDHLIVSSNSLSADYLINQIETVHNREKALSSSESSQSQMIQTVRSLTQPENLLPQYKAYITKTAQYYQAAFFVLDEYFQNSTVYENFIIYNPYSQHGHASNEKTAVLENAADVVEDKQIAKIKYLEKTIHELKVKMDYAQKDAVREIIMTLASSGFGAPLFELQQMKKSNDTPEHIASAISNLFLALESLDVRFYKESLVGQSMAYDEIEEGMFCLKNDETLESTDRVVVKYPGIKLGKETIVKPTITKEN